MHERERAREKQAEKTRGGGRGQRAEKTRGEKSGGENEGAENRRRRRGCRRRRRKRGGRKQAAKTRKTESMASGQLTNKHTHLIAANHTTTNPD
jgi:hypothetical protein